MSNKLENFDKQIKSHLENYEAPYSPTEWEFISKKISAKPQNSLNALKITGIITGVIAIAIFGYVFINTPNNRTTTDMAIVNPIKKEVEIAENDNNLLQNQKNLNQQQQIENKPSTINKNQSQGALTPQSKAKTETAALNTNKPNTPNQSDDNSSVNIHTKSVEYQFAVEASKRKLCLSEVVQFSVKSKSKFQYQWDFGDGNTSKAANPTHQYKQPGIYAVGLTINDKKGDVVAVYNKAMEIVVNKKPDVNFDFETTDHHCHNSSICFRVENAQNKSYFWNFGDNRYSTEENPKHTYFKKGHYTVKLRAESQDGCKDSIAKQVYVMRAYNLLAPNSFSPNGDGQNDTWFPIALKTGNQKFKLSIVNQNGDEVFSTTNSQHEWDGNAAQNGETYFWVAMVTDETGNLNEYGGTIEIIEK